MSVQGAHQTERKSCRDPNETRESPLAKAEILEAGGSQIGRVTFEPGRRWPS